MSTRRTRSTLLSPPPGAFRSPSVQSAEDRDAYVEENDDSLFVTPVQPTRRSNRIANTGSSVTTYNDGPTSAITHVTRPTPSKPRNSRRPPRKPKPQLALDKINPPPGLSETHLQHILTHKAAYDALLAGINHRAHLRKYIETRNRIWKSAMEKTQARLEEIENERLELEGKMAGMVEAQVEFEGIYAGLAGDEGEDARVKGVWDNFMGGEEAEGLDWGGEELRAPVMSPITERGEESGDDGQMAGELGMRAPSRSPITEDGREGLSEKGFDLGGQVYEEP